MRDDLGVSEVEYNICKEKIRTKFNSLGIDDKVCDKMVFKDCHVVGNHCFVFCLKFKHKEDTKDLLEEAKKILNARLVFVIIKKLDEVLIDDIQITIINDYNDFIVFMSGIVDIIKSSYDSIYKYFDEGKIDKYLNKLMGCLKISPKMTGYNYLAECIKIYLCVGANENLLLKDVYQLVAKRFDKSVDNIEKSIRSAIKQSTEDYPELYKCVCRTDKVTALFLIKYMVNNIKTEICCRESIRFYNKIFA